MTLNTRSLYLVLIAFTFIFSPFISFLLALFLLNQKELDKRGYKGVYFLISLFWGFLAFTQKSTGVMDTDIIRYYASYRMLLTEDIKIVLALNFEDILTYTFTTINVVIVTTMRNVQYISLFWTTFTYYLYFISIHKILEFKGLTNKRNIFLLVVSSLFCFLLFVMITETIKNVAAFALFFYVLSRVYTGKRDLLNWGLLFLSAGIHMSIVMLIPLLFYRRFNTSLLIGIALVSFPILAGFNVMTIVPSILPSSGFAELLVAKSETYSVGAKESSIRYIAILSYTFIIAIYIWLVKSKKNDSLSNIIILYFIVSSFNYVNLDGYSRFANFSHFIFALIFISLINTKDFAGNKFYMFRKVILQSTVLLMMFMTLRMTNARLFSGGYTSSYMDNSIVKIITAPSWRYLDVKYDDK